MKKLLLLAAASVVAGQSSYASLNFSDNFDSYANGALVGQGTWAQTGASATSPIQVSSGAVTLGTSGQDVYAPLSTPISLTDGSSFYIGLDVDIASAQSTGDYFLHWSTPAGTTTTFQERLYVKSSGAGFVFGYDGSSGGTINYSSTVLNLSQDYRVVLSYNVVAGALNDTFSLYVNPTDTSVEGNNTAYMTSGYIGTGAEQTTVSAINFRQGTASSAAGVTVDNLNVATTFGEAAPAIVPEPSAVALSLLGGLAGLAVWIRRR